MNALATAVLALAVLAGPADKCRPNAEPGTSADGTIRVVPTTEWTFEWQKKGADGAFATVHKGKLLEVGHPHLYAHVFNSGVFVVVNPHGGHERGNRVVFYQPDGAVLRANGLADFLTAEELEDLAPSVSHIRWLGHEGEKFKISISEKDGTYELVTKWGKTIRFDAKTGERRKEG